MREMVGSGGMDAVLLKVAGMGLREQDVGRSLKEMLPRLERLVRRGVGPRTAR